MRVHTLYCTNYKYCAGTSVLCTTPPNRYGKAANDPSQPRPHHLPRAGAVELTARAVRNMQFPVRNATCSFPVRARPLRIKRAAPSTCRAPLPNHPMVRANH